MKLDHRADINSIIRKTFGTTKDMAAFLGVTTSAVNQVLNGDYSSGKIPGELEKLFGASIDEIRTAWKNTAFQKGERS